MSATTVRSVMLKVLTGLIMLLLIPLALIPFLIVAIAFGPVLVMLLFATGCGGWALGVGSALVAIVMSIRALAMKITGQQPPAEVSPPAA